MTAIMVPPARVPPLPDHTQLPDKDDSMVTNFQEHPQSRLLSSSLEPVLRQIHPNDHYCIGQDTAIYFRPTAPPMLGARAPDWFYIPDVPPTLAGLVRRSYVLWQERVPPRVVLEYVSGDGSEERDRTPETGKFWVYEQAIGVQYYGIYFVDPGRVEMYHRVAGQLGPMAANERGHYPIPELGVELGIWQGLYLQYELPWLRWWDAQGNLLLTAEEREEQERQAKELERQAKELAQRRAERLAERLRALGIDPDTV